MPCWTFLLIGSSGVASLFLQNSKNFWKKCAPRDGFFHREIVESMAPVRSEPKRTYDPLTAVPAPGGDDVPKCINELRISLWKKSERVVNHLQKNSASYGEQSGIVQLILCIKTCPLTLRAASLTLLARMEEDIGKIGVIVAVINIMDVWGLDGYFLQPRTCLFW